MDDLDYTKDILYIEAEKAFERRAVQSTLYDITLGILKLLTPIIPHTTSEAYQLLPFTHEDDVYLENMPEKKAYDQTLLKTFDVFEEVREVVLKTLEEAREQKLFGKSLAAEVELTVTNEQMDAIKNLDMKLHQVLIVSKVELHTGDTLKVKVKPAEGHTCARCWNVVDHVDEHGLCPRCDSVLGGK